MVVDGSAPSSLPYAGEWVAVSQGHVIAHGRDFHKVAQEACGKAQDISFDRVPDPRAPMWREAPELPTLRNRFHLGAEADRRLSGTEPILPADPLDHPPER